MSSIEQIINEIFGPLGFLIGVFSGVSAHFIGNWVWSYYKRPKLSFRQHPKASFQTDDEGQPEARHFRLQVENEGRKAALNCKPEFCLNGELDGNEYEIESNLCWSEGSNPSRITINQNELVSFDLFKMTAVQRGHTVSGPPAFYISFPSETGWDSNSRIIKWIRNEDGNITDAQFQQRLELSEFRSINWNIQEVKVTSKNAELLEASFSLQRNVEDARGLIGMRIKLH